MYDKENPARKRRVVVIGGGFAGLNFVKHLDSDMFDVTLVDRNNYHSFPPCSIRSRHQALTRPASVSLCVANCANAMEDEYGSAWGWWRRSTP